MTALKMCTIFNFMKNFQYVSFGILEMQANINLAWKNAFILLKMRAMERMISRVCYFIDDSQLSKVHIYLTELASKFIPKTTLMN